MSGRCRDGIWRFLATVVLLVTLVGCEPSQADSRSQDSPRSPGSYDDRSHKFDPKDPCPKADPAKLRVGVKYDVPQFGYYDEQKRTWTGFDVDMAKEAAKGLKKTLVLVPTATDDRIPLLTGRNEDKSPNKYGRPCVDVVFSTFTITPEREERGVAFSHPYWVDHQVFLTKRGGRVPIITRSPAVCTTPGSTSVKFVHELLPQVEVREEKYLRDCYGALQRDEVVAVTSGEILLLGFLIRDPDHLQFSGKPFSREPYGAGVWNERPDRQQLVESINKVIDETKTETDGRWRRFCQKWVRSLMETPCDPPKADVNTALMPQS